uniref:Uncharacterized protein n=2 Tax=Ursus TaxID=9639 RepID=A0A452TRM5_URSMA
MSGCRGESASEQGPWLPFPATGPTPSFSLRLPQLCLPLCLPVILHISLLQKWFKQRLAQWRQSEGLPSECRSVTD